MKAKLLQNKVVIEEGGKSLYDKSGFGTLKKEKLELSMIEALYLLEGNKIEIYSGSRKLSVAGFINAVYKNIRSRGYVTKTALKYGADFLVYPRGKKPWEGHSKLALFCVHESEDFDWRKFAALNRVSHSVKKDLLIGIVDDMGDVTYYTVSWTKP
jgi:tRNA-intron endonuclease